jgi:hypothetical protein
VLVAAAAPVERRSIAVHAMTRTVALFDLVAAVADEATSDAEVVATVAHMLNAGMVRLGGRRRARVDLRVATPVAA